MKQKRLFLWMVAGMWLFSGILPAEKLSKDSELHVFNCRNGIPVIAQRLRSGPIVHIVLALRAGSKFESPNRTGLSHLLEHLMLFSDQGEATSGFSAELRHHGGMINAHTGRDLMNFEITLPSDRLNAGLSILQRVVFGRTFTHTDLSREKLVVKQEWKESRDDPTQRGTRLLLQMMFPGHPYGRSTFGSMQDLDGLDLTAVHAFYQAYCRPDRCSMAVVGDLDPFSIEKELNVGIGSMVITPDSGPSTEIQLTKALSEKNEAREFMDIHQAHLFIGFHAPPFNHEHRTGMRVITQMLGGGIYPLLSNWLVGRFQLVSSAKMNYLPLGDGGCAWAHLVLDPDNLKRVNHEFFNFLKQFRNMNFSPLDFPPARRRGVFDFMSSAMNQLRIRSESGRESGMQRALAYARFALLNRRQKPESFEKQLSKLTPSRLRTLAGKYFLGVSHTIVVLLPREER